MIVKSSNVRIFNLHKRLNEKGYTNKVQNFEFDYYKMSFYKDKLGDA